MITWRNIRSAYVRARLRLRPSVGRPHRPGAPGSTSAAPLRTRRGATRAGALRSAVVAEQVGLVVQELHARDVRLGEGPVEGQKRRPDRLGRVARIGLVGWLVAISPPEMRRGRTYCQARSIASPTPASELQRRISAAQSSAMASANRASSRWRSLSSRSRQSQPARSPRVANSPRSTVLPFPRMSVASNWRAEDGLRQGSARTHRAARRGPRGTAGQRRFLAETGWQGVRFEDLDRGRSLEILYRGA